MSWLDERLMDQPTHPPHWYTDTITVASIIRVLVLYGMLYRDVDKEYKDMWCTC